jgi:hypothetical protein
MMLQLKQTFEQTKSRSLRREAILKAEREGQTHLSHIEEFLRAKYELKEGINREILGEAQKQRLYNEITNRTNHGKLYKARLDPMISVEDSAMWLKHGNIRPQDEATYCSLQDRNIFFGTEGKCPHCQIKMKTVDHMATQCDRMLAHHYMRRHNEALRCIHLQICRKYGLTKNKKIGSHSVQECIIK